MVETVPMLFSVSPFWPVVVGNIIETGLTSFAVVVVEGSDLTEEIEILVIIPLFDVLTSFNIDDLGRLLVETVSSIAPVLADPEDSVVIVVEIRLAESDTNDLGVACASVSGSCFVVIKVKVDITTRILPLAVSVRSRIVISELSIPIPVSVIVLLAFGFVGYIVTVIKVIEVSVVVILLIEALLKLK